ncbi:DUF1501 domain-containing protein [Caulobacter sp. SSI4214]|uniref:DUF1501 domain-containing protein n=1 Tax=Caulobacter sp. SSI4214 TaxID=2575739 RepID=UPI001F50427F|nr:DUF1501 domain-containing protein [Caulobacter sp. SSI4214]
MAKAASLGFAMRESKASGAWNETGAGHDRAPDLYMAFLKVGGWDTHVNGGGATGILADRVGQLSCGLAGFVTELGSDIWAQTTVVVVSKFGRTFKENGDKGADHGHGSVYWVLGGTVNGGRINGHQDELMPKNLNQNIDLPVHT